MSLIVQKFGGTSVGSAERIAAVAERVVATARAGHSVAVIVSAMGGETSQLLELAEKVGGHSPTPRELDVLLATGEQKTIGLLAMAIERLGHPAHSFTGERERCVAAGCYDFATKPIEKAALLDIVARNLVSS